MPYTSRCVRTLSLSLALALAACSSRSSPPPPPSTVRVTVSPHDLTLPAGGAHDFTATVTGTSETTVQWTIDGGTLSGSGATVGWAAPAVGGTFHVTATSVANAAASDTAVVTVLPPGSVVVPADPGGAVTMSLDTTQARPISRFIYGVNFLGYPYLLGNDVPAGISLSRLGGNRLTAYDWETSHSNCGNDCGTTFPNDAYLSSSAVPGAATKARADLAFSAGAAFMATIPVLGWVAGDAAGGVPVPLAPSRTTPATPDAARFKVSAPSNPGGPAATPSLTDRVTYQDDYVAWLDATYPDARTDPLKPLFFSLDNEPDLWGYTHAEIRGQTAAGESVFTGFDELPQLSIPYARAVKSVLPGAKVFGPALSGWFGFMTLGQPAVPPGYAWYVDKYLDAMRAAETSGGQRLLDVLDVHWYPEATNVCGPSDPPACSGGQTTNCCYASRIGNEYQPQWPSVIEARVQAPRSLWDPTYVERSWVAQAIPGCSSGTCAVRLLPRLSASVDAHYPGTGLAITEYYYGRGGDISGGIAQADVLGIFGREGVYAATLWPNAAIWSYGAATGCTTATDCATRAYACLFAAFRAYLDYDGAGSGFGDLSVGAATSDVASTSVYASVRSGGAGEVVVVAINKTMAAVSTGFAVKHAALLTRAEVYRIAASGDPALPGCSGPARQADLSPVGTNAFLTTLPAMSVSVLVLRP